MEIFSKYKHFYLLYDEDRYSVNMYVFYINDTQSDKLKRINEN